MIVDKIFASGKFGVYTKNEEGKLKLISEQFNDIKDADDHRLNNYIADKNFSILGVPNTEKWGLWMPTFPGDAELVSPKFESAEKVIKYAREHNIKVDHIQEYDEEGNLKNGSWS